MSTTPSPAAAPAAPSPTPPSRWQRISLRTKVTWAVVIAIIGGITALREAVFTPLWNVYVHRQPAYDAERLSRLQPGILFAEFQQRLAAEPVAIIRTNVTFMYGEKALRASDQLFVLPTAFVEAFTEDSTTTTLAYTVTWRGAKKQERISVGSTHVDFGATTIASAVMTNRALVAGGCGAHIGSYFEISDNSNANTSRRFSVGHTSTGYERPEEPFKQPGICAPLPNNLPAPFSQVPSVTPSTSGDYAVDVADATGAFLALIDSSRKEVLVNSFSITAPSIEFSPDLVSLHPDVVRGFVGE